MTDRGDGSACACMFSSSLSRLGAGQLRLAPPPSLPLISARISPYKIPDVSTTYLSRLPRFVTSRNAPPDCGFDEAHRYGSICSCYHAEHTHVLYHRRCQPPTVMAQPTQQLPSWLTLTSTLVTADDGSVSTSVGTLTLPLTYYGASVSLASLEPFSSFVPYLRGASRGPY